MGETLYDHHGKLEVRTFDDLCKALAQAGGQYYVYVLCRQAGERLVSPFYVGVGQGYRLFAHEVEARDPRAVGTKVDIIRSILNADEHLFRFVDGFYRQPPWRREEALINAYGLIRDGTGILANQNRYAESATVEGVELRKYATQGNILPSNFHKRHVRLTIGPRCPKNPRSVFGRICDVLRQHPGVTGEQLVELLQSVDFSMNQSAYTQSGQVSVPWLAKYIDGGFYAKNQYIQEYEGR